MYDRSEAGATDFPRAWMIGIVSGYLMAECPLLAEAVEEVGAVKYFATLVPVS